MICYVGWVDGWIDERKEGGREGWKEILGKKKPSSNQTSWSEQAPLMFGYSFYGLMIVQLLRLMGVVIQISEKHQCRKVMEKMYFQAPSNQGAC